MILVIGYYSFVYKAPGDAGTGNASVTGASSGLNASGTAPSGDSAGDAGINDWYTDPAYPYKPRAEHISVAEAVDRVRSFMHDDKANVTLERVDATVKGFETYVMDYGNSSFRVAVATGEVTSAFFLDNYTESDATISEDDARAIAGAYAREHYYGFDSMKGMQFFSSRLLDHGAAGKEYEIIYRQVVDDVPTLNSVMVYVDGGTGKVHSYYSGHMPTSVSLDYTVSKRDAVRTAVSGIGNITAEETSGDQESAWTYELNARTWLSNSTNATVKNIQAQRMVTLDSNMTQHAVWSIVLDASWPVSMPDSRQSEDGFQYTISVDGKSGEVVFFEHCL